MADETMLNETNLGDMKLDRQDVSEAEAQATIHDLLEAVGDEELIADDRQSLQDENAQLKDQNLRLVADMENLRRRTLRDVADAKSYAVANFARDMLSVLDNLARALDAIAPDVRESDSHLNALAEGVEMTSRAMITALERHGVKKIEAQGAKFDPHIHQAMFEVADPNQPTGTVAQVVQEGYMIAERVLRPAMVGITTGGVKETTAETGI